MKMCDIEFGTEESWLDGEVRTVDFHDGDGIHYTGRAYGEDRWAIYFAMDLKTGAVHWSHGVDLLGVAPYFLKDKDQHVMNAVFKAYCEGLTEWSGVMEMAALEYEGQESLI